MILDVGDVESLGSIVAKPMGENLSGVAAGYELTAEVATDAANAAEFDFSSTGFATIDVFEVQDNTNTMIASAAEVDAGHELRFNPAHLPAERLPLLLLVISTKISPAWLLSLMSRSLLSTKQS